MPAKIEIEDEGVEVLRLSMNALSRQAGHSLERLQARPESAARDDAIAEREREQRTAVSILGQLPA